MISSLINNIIRSNKKIFILFWILSIAFYLTTYHGGFYEDFQGIVTRDRGRGFLDYIFRKDLHVPDLYFGNYAVNYILYHTFGLNPVYWYLCFASLHALNGLIVFRFFKELFDRFQWVDHTFVIFTGVLFWLISPVYVEAISWKACVHYLISAFLLISILRYFVKYLFDGKKSQLALVLLLFTLSTTFWEGFYLTPIFCLVIAFALFYTNRINKSTFYNKAVITVTLLLLLFGLYYFTLIRFTGNVTARFGVEVYHNMTINDIATKLCFYPVHFYTMEYLLPGSVMQNIMNLLHTNWLHISFLFAALLLLVWGSFRFKIMTPQYQLLFLLIILSLGSVCILLPMPISEIFPYLYGRFYYQAGIFSYMTLSVLLFTLIRNNTIRYLISSLYLLASSLGLLKIGRNVYHANKVFFGTMEHFNFKNTDTVMLLNIPGSYRGIGLIGTDKAGNLGIHVNMYSNPKSLPQEYDICSYNMESRWDGAHVKVEDSTTLKVTLNQFGTWWWYEGLGACDYETDLYSVKMIDNGMSYLLHFKQKPSASTVILCHKNYGWFKIDMNKTGEEQW